MSEADVNLAENQKIHQCRLRMNRAEAATLVAKSPGHFNWKEVQLSPFKLLKGADTKKAKDFQGNAVYVADIS